MALDNGDIYILAESGLSEVQVRLNLDAAIRQYKKNKRLEKAKN
jgi:hypothetical protein